MPSSRQCRWPRFNPWSGNQIPNVAAKLGMPKLKTLHHVSVLVLLYSTFCDSMNSSPAQAPLSMGCSRQEYWSGLPVPSPGDLPDPGIEPRFPTLQANSLPSKLLMLQQ